MPKTVLIADGRKFRLRRLAALVDTLGYRVLQAGDGSHGLRLAASEWPDVTLIGSHLHDLDVDVFAQEIKRRCRDTEVLVLVDEPWVVEALKHLAAGFVVWPTKADLLDVHLQRAIERAAMRRRLRKQPGEITKKVEKQFSRRLETERFLVVKQIVDKLSTFIGRVARDVEGGIRYFNEMPYFVAIHDGHGQVLAANRSYRMLLGRRAGDDSWSVYEGQAGTAEGSPVNRTIRTSTAQESREILCYRSGARVPVIVHTAPIYDNDGEVELVLEVSVGTQNMDHLRDELRTTQQRYQLLFDAVPCYVAVLDRGLLISAGNRLFTNEFGDKTGASFRDVFYVDDEAFAASPIHKTFTEGKPHHGEMILIGPGGRRYNMLVWTSPMATPAGKLMQVLLIFLDITQIRDLQSNLAALGLMIGSIAHSIKGVLTGLDAGVYLLDKGFGKHDDEQTRSGLDIVRRMVERVRKMILDILFCAKERELQREYIQVQTLAEEAAATVRSNYTDRGVKLDCEFLQPLGTFEVDSGLLQSAVVNLLENAADACTADGTDREHRVVFGVRGGLDEVEIAVEDNGVGMTSEQLKNLFTMFFSTKGAKGTGLGLFITDKIVRQHGGSITTESTPGRGSRFCITLPRKAKTGEHRV